MKIRALIICILISLSGSGQNVKLAPCSEVYNDVFPENYKDKSIDIQYFVNIDTTDHNGYLNIKKGKLYRQLKIEYFTESPPCAKPILSFYNHNKVAFLSNCMNSKYLLVVDLECGKCDKYLEPYLISLKDSLIIYQDDTETKTFYISGLDFKTLKKINLEKMYDCANTHDCFVKIGYKNGVVTFVYLDEKQKNKTVKVKVH